MAEQLGMLFRGIRTERGLQRLKPWLTRSAEPEMIAWVLSDFAKYVAMAGQMEAALTLAQQACRTAKTYCDPIELYLRRYDYGRLLLAVERAYEALRILPEPAHQNRVHETEEVLIMAEAHLRAGSTAEGQTWLQRANDAIETHNLDSIRLKADALAQRFRWCRDYACCPIPQWSLSASASASAR